jgi:hypothetical protein
MGRVLIRMTQIHVQNKSQKTDMWPAYQPLQGKEHPWYWTWQFINTDHKSTYKLRKT